MQLKKLIVLLVGLSFAPNAQAALTTAQVKQVRTAVNQMESTLFKIMNLANATDSLLNNGNSYTIAFSTVPINLTSQQQQDIVAYYQLLKAQLQTQLNSMP